jgi:bifunctional UDP-N-acetylglucosamine pyrophosphorylase/glucosamine-1-phosphate N-acetyltransferase
LSRRRLHRTRVAVILAAGRGTRMRSEVPKVLHSAGGRPLLAWVVAAAREAGCKPIFVVVPPDFEDFRTALTAEPAGLPGDVVEGLRFVVQASRKGTGHALLQAGEAVREVLAGDPEEATLLVLSGDTPLLTADTLERLATVAEEGESPGEPPWGALAVATLEDPGSLGRVLTREDGSLKRIVEASDASEEELGVRRINAGIYALRAPRIFQELARLDSDNAQGEIYLTDAPGAAAARGERVVLLDLEDPTEALGVNTRAELTRVHRILMDRRKAVGV